MKTGFWLPPLPCVLGLLTALLPGPVRAQVDPALVHAQAISGYTNATSCTVCHSRVAAEVMATTHWTWEHTDPVNGDKLGKNRVINNYCIAMPSNEPRCTSCHVGLGYADKTFDFSDASKVDCLVCHDTTGTYRKFPTGAGHPVYGTEPKEFPAGSGTLWYPPDLVKVAQQVGRSSRATCGACHFFGGGGDAVKHGDLDSTLTNPSRELDVHMGVDGANMTCADCHVEPGEDGRGHHEFLGSHYTEAAEKKPLGCTSCHGERPHPLVPLLDNHTDSLACQACHIPAFARGGKATKMTWDWSTAGQKTPDGKAFIAKDAQGNPIYDTQKGTFTWAAEVVPEYVWFNGQVDYLTIDETVDPSGMVRLTAPGGSIEDPSARIYPVKHFTARQPYDAGNRTLVAPHLFPRNASDTNAYWKSYRWDWAVQAGMDYVGKPYSGELGFVDTEMFWIQNHMVAPKEQALWCTACHVPRGRMNFAALGYPADRALALQTMAGFEIDAVEMVLQAERARLTWTSTPGHAYRVQVSTDLMHWSDAPNGSYGPSQAVGELTWEEAGAPAASSRFYRIRRH